MRRVRVSPVLILLILVSFVVGPGPLGAADQPTKAAVSDAPTKVAPAPTIAPELARFNDLLAGLAENLKPAIVHVRVRRAAVTRDRDKDEPDGEQRRSSEIGRAHV